MAEGNHKPKMVSDDCEMDFENEGADSSSGAECDSDVADCDADECGITVVKDDKYDNIKKSDLKLYKSIPKEKKKSAVIPVSAIAQSEWSEFEHYNEHGIDFKYVAHYQEHSRDYDYHVKELEKLRKSAVELQNGKPVHGLHLRGFICGTAFTGKVDEVRVEPNGRFIIMVQSTEKKSRNDTGERQVRKDLRQVSLYAFLFNGMVSGKIAARHIVRLMRISNWQKVKLGKVSVIEYIENVLAEFRKLPKAKFVQEDYLYEGEVLDSFRAAYDKKKVKRNVMAKLPYFLGIRGPRDEAI